MSAPAEVLFFEMGDVVTKKRNRSSTDLTRMAAFLKYRGAFHGLTEVAYRSLVNDDSGDDSGDDSNEDSNDRDEAANLDGVMVDSRQSEGSGENMPVPISVDD